MLLIKLITRTYVSSEGVKWTELAQVIMQ